MKRKILMGFLAMSLVFNLGAVSTEAAVKRVRLYKPSGQTFKSDWVRNVKIFYKGEEYADINSIADMKIGYNTWWVDEDYVKVYSTLGLHQARIVNKNGTYTSAGKDVGQWSVIETEHVGNNPLYVAILKEVAATDSFTYKIME